MFGFFKHKIFISYDNRNKPFVDENIVARVKNAKHKPWFAPDDIAVGDDWEVRLDEALDACDRILVVISTESLESTWVGREVRMFIKQLKERGSRGVREARRAILPVVIEERGEYGKEIPNTKNPDGSSFHARLGSINNVCIPHNAQVDEKLNDKGQYPGVENLAEADRKSVQKYIAERSKALKKLDRGIRNPRAGGWGYSPLARMVPSYEGLQTVALAAFLVTTLLLLLMLPGGLLNRESDFFKPKFNPVINPTIEPKVDIDLSPIQSETTSASQTKKSQYHFVRTQADRDGLVSSDGFATEGSIEDVRSPSDAVPDLPNIEPVEIQIQSINLADAIKAEKEGKFVRKLEMTVELNGIVKTFSEYVKLEPKVIPPTLEMEIDGMKVDLENPSPLSMKSTPLKMTITASQQKEKPTVRVLEINPRAVAAKLDIKHKDGTPVRDGRVLISDPVDLVVTASIDESPDEGNQPQAELTLVPQHPPVGPVEIEWAEKADGTWKKLPLSEDAKKAKEIPLPGNHVVFQVAKTTDAKEYAKFRITPAPVVVPNDMYLAALHEIYNRSEVVAGLRANFPDKFQLWSKDGYTQDARNKYLEDARKGTATDEYSPNNRIPRPAE